MSVCSFPHIVLVSVTIYILSVNILFPICIGGTAKAACYAVKRLGLKLLITNIQEEAGIEVAKRSEL